MILVPIMLPSKKLDRRREQLISKLVIKTAKNNKFAWWFKKNEGQNRTKKLDNQLIGRNS